MQAAVLDGDGLRVRDVPAPRARDGEALIRVRCAGICETDLQLIRGYMGFRGILGHEFVGVAESGRFAGERVVGEINCACHACPTCDEGLPNHCPHRTVIGILGRDGAFAEFLTVPEHNLHRVPECVTDEQAVFVEPLAAAFQVVAQIPDLEGRRVVVLGDGRLGQLCAQVLKFSDTRLTVVGKHPLKLQKLRDLAIDAILRDDSVPDRRADVVVDCTGSPSGIQDAFRWLKPRGTLVLKTTVAGEPALSWAPIVIDEFRVIGSRCGPFEPALRALADRTVDVEPLIEARYPLSRATEAIEVVRVRSALKVLLTPGD